MEFIRNLDIALDVSILRELGIPESSVSTFKISSTLLKAGAEAGLTLRDIGDLVLGVVDLAADLNSNVGPLTSVEGAAPPGGHGTVLERLVALAKGAQSASGSVDDLFGDEELQRFSDLVGRYLRARYSGTGYVTPAALVCAKGLEGGPLQRQAAIAP